MHCNDSNLIPRPVAAAVFDLMTVVYRYARCHLRNVCYESSSNDSFNTLYIQAIHVIPDNSIVFPLTTVVRNR